MNVNIQTQKKVAALKTPHPALSPKGRGIRSKKILVTAGPTREWMDPARFLSNPSSGALGITLAETLRKKKADVTLIVGPTHLPTPKNVNVISVVTALQMFEKVKKYLPRSDAFIATAAVGDWRFARAAQNKLKRSSAKAMPIRLIRNPDILAWGGRFKKREGKRLLLVGFALETQDRKKNALKKLREKNVDLIIANAPRSFSNQRIRPLWIERRGTIKQFPSMHKKTLSLKIVRWLDRQWNTA